jgi:hypothetical protein
MLQVASDCLNIVKEINGSPARGKHCMITKEIERRRSKFLEVAFVHERREPNEDAHRLARMATTLDIRHVWLNNPQNIWVSM